MPNQYQMVSKTFTRIFSTLWNGRPLSLYIIVLGSTLFTSIWIASILLSATVLKLLAPMHRFTAWLFDVEKHPIQAIDIVTGALVMIGALTWTVLRSVV
jgi:hypothetical protein